MSTASELIRRIDFFQPLDDRLIETIARVCITREYSSGDYIVRQGDPGLGLYFLTRGSARVEIARDGSVLPIAQLHAGEFVGELSIIDNKPRSANVVCATDASCLLLTRDRFTKLLNKYPEIALQMAKALAARLRSTDERMWQSAAGIPQPELTDAPPPPPPPPPRSDARRIKDMLTETISWIYLPRSFTQFSLAVVGCPVDVSLETRASRTLMKTIGPLKVVAVPSDEAHRIGVHGFAEGDFRVTILRPGLAGAAARFDGTIRRDESRWFPICASKPRGPGEKLRDFEAALDF